MLLTSANKNMMICLWEHRPPELHMLCPRICRLAHMAFWRRLLHQPATLVLLPAQTYSIHCQLNLPTSMCFTQLLKPCLIKRGSFEANKNGMSGPWEHRPPELPMLYIGSAATYIWHSGAAYYTSLRLWFF
jgi:hypothetical protein